MDSLANRLPEVNGRARFVNNDATIARRAALEAFNSVPIGIIIADDNARILHLNRIAEDIVQQGRGLVVHNDLLAANTRADTARLRQTISDVIIKARHGGGTRAQAMSLYRSSSAHPLTITIKPMWCPDSDDPRRRLGPLVNLIVADLDRQMEAPADLLGRVFDLTPAESVVLERLVNGLTLQEIADVSGTSRNTVRNQLHIVFEKTGTRRQAELIKLVLSTAVWTHGEATTMAGSRPN
jgi:DNA-binding CsgD family transcriptional regulator